MLRATKMKVLEPGELWQKPLLTPDTFLDLAPTPLPVEVGVDVGYKNFATLSTGEYLNGLPSVIARHLAATYKAIYTEASSHMLRDFGSFFSYLQHYCEEEGSTYRQVGPYYASTRICSQCKYRHPALPLSVRAWQCLYCQAKHDRDVNAAKNILREGQRISALRAVHA